MTFINESNTDTISTEMVKELKNLVESNVDLISPSLAEDNQIQGHPDDQISTKTTTAALISQTTIRLPSQTNSQIRFSSNNNPRCTMR